MHTDTHIHTGFILYSYSISHTCACFVQQRHHADIDQQMCVQEDEEMYFMLCTQEKPTTCQQEPATDKHPVMIKSMGKLLFTRYGDMRYMLYTCM